MSSSDEKERERVSIRKEAISTLEKAIEEYGHEAARGSFLACTLRRWKGIVAREEGDWAGARFEFLQGRSLAESFDPGNVAWFDAALAEAEIWEAFGRPGLEFDTLKELVDKLDRTSGLYSLAGDRSNTEFIADWAQWFRFFLLPAVPAPALVARIAEAVERLKQGSEPAAGKQSPLGGYVFMWNYFWFSALARRREAVLRGVFASTSNLDELVRFASILAPTSSGFGPLLKAHIYRGQESPASDSPDDLLRRITVDLEAYHAVEKDTDEYVSKVQELWMSASPQKKREVEHAMHPKKQPHGSMPPGKKAG
ncbi:MAG: hypothetical protein OK449_00870 [Thaumarchaeota archaeon]|nr:hypothetical protein [Nitrososphaerota archaeon]